MMHTYLPQISNGPAAPEPSGQADFISVLIGIMSGDPNQNRKQVIWDSVLMGVAQARADDMLKRSYFNHVDPDGHAANWYVRQAGYKLPDNYSKQDNGNNVESLGLNYFEPQDVWQGWLNSPAHREHVLGVGFFAAQTNVGIGFAVGEEKYPRYWVLISAPPQSVTVSHIETATLPGPKELRVA